MGCDKRGEVGRALPPDPWQSDKLSVPFIKIKESIPTFNQWVILNKMMEWLSSGMMFLGRESSVC